MKADEAFRQWWLGGDAAHLPYDREGIELAFLAGWRLAKESLRRGKDEGMLPPPAPKLPRPDRGW